MPDEWVADDREQYDEPMSFAFCPTCGGPLEFDDSMSKEGYTWWCQACDGVKLTVRPIRLVDSSREGL